MRHYWIFDVLRDLRSYAVRNDLPALAAKVDEALAVAEAEIDAAEGEAGEGPGRADTGPVGRAH